MSTEAETIYGIDLGTTYSAIARVDDYGKPEILTTIDHDNTTPSAVYFESPERHVVGKSAKAEALIEPLKVAQLFKREMGDPTWKFTPFTESESAAALSSMVLRKLAEDAERRTGKTVRDVVITVPAYFGERERAATKEAGLLANLNVVDILNEPTAAAYSYGLLERSVVGKVEHVLVYDLGGGTFDATVIKLATDEILTVATDGNHHLGGADIDRDLAEALADSIMKDTGSTSSPMDEPHVAQYLYAQAESAKRNLSDKQSTTVHYVFEGTPGKINLTQNELEDLAGIVLEQTVELTTRVLAAAQEKGVTNIDRLLLVGGQSKMPAVSKILLDRFGLKGEIKDPDLSVVKGAALYAYTRQLQGATKGILVGQGVIKPHQSIQDAPEPSVQQAVQTVAATTSMSASTVQQIVAKKFENVLSHGFGIFVLNESNTLIARFLAHQNDTLPLVRESLAYTVADDQTAVQFPIFEQGGSDESEDIEDAHELYVGEIQDIPRGYPKGTPIKLLLSMTESGLLELRGQHPGQPTPMIVELQVSGGAGDPEALAAEKERLMAKVIKDE